MALRAAPHSGSIWRRVAAASSDYAEELSTRTSVADDVPLDLQLASGDVEGRAYGRVGTGEHQLFMDAGVDLRQDDIIRIDESDNAAMVNRRFAVKNTMDWGARGGVQGAVEDSEEILPDEVAS